MRKLSGIVAFAVALIVALAGNQAAYAVANPSDGTLDTSFNGVLAGGVSNYVADSVMQPDGKVIMVGDFRTYNGSDAKFAVRINIDGTIDSTFNTGLGISSTGGVLRINAVDLQPDGKIIIGGAFDLVAGHASQSVARLNSDGSFDATFVSPIAPFNASTNPNVAVQDVAVASDGSVVIVGSFNQAVDANQNLVVVKNVVKASSTGNLDTTFNTNFGGATSGAISGSTITSVGEAAITYAVAIQSDGKILIGGNFNVIGGTSIRIGLARLLTTGAIDAAFDGALTGLGVSINEISIDSNGKILVTGAMSGAGSTASPGFVRLLPSTGAFDTSFSGLAAGFGGPSVRLYSSFTASDGSIYVAGLFTSYNGVGRVGLVRLLSDGSLDTSLVVGAGLTNTTSGGSIRSIIPLGTGDVLISGLFDKYDGVSRTGVALLTSAAAITARTAPSNNNSNNSSNTNNSNSSNTSNSSNNNTPSFGNSSPTSSASGNLANTGTSNPYPVALGGAFLLFAGLSLTLFAVARRRVDKP